MSGQRAAARIARRELRRRPVTTLLVALLVALPVAAMIMLAVLARSEPIPTEVQRLIDVGSGQASVVVARDRAASTAEAIHASSPTVEVAPLTFQGGTLEAPGGDRVSTEVLSAEFGDPLLIDRFPVREGRMPDQPGEVAISSVVADVWDAQVGDAIRFDELDLDAEVVGIADTAGANGGEVFVSTFPDLDPSTVETQLFIGDPAGLTPATLEVLRPHGWSGVVRFEPGFRPPWPFASTTPFGLDIIAGQNVMWTWLGGALTLAVMGVVISAAFAVGARRQLRVLGLASASGAPGSVVRGVVLWQGAWVGVGGTALGGLLAFAALAAAWPHHGRFIHHDPTWWVVVPVDLIPIVALGITASVISAALPARTAGRISVLRALAGRRPLAPVRARVIVGGFGASVAGLALLAAAVVGQRLVPYESRWTAVAIAGGLALLGGSTALAPAFVAGAGRLARFTRGSTHLALRSLARQRSRSGAVVAGVAAAAALCFGTSAAVASSAAVDQQRRSSSLPEHVVAVSAWGQLPSAPVPPTEGPIPTDGSSPPPRFGPATERQWAAIGAALPGAVRIDTPIATAKAVPDVTVADPASGRNRSWITPLAAPASPALVDALAVPDAARAALDRGESVALGADASTRQFDLTGHLGAGFGPDGGPTSIAVTPFPDAERFGSLPSVLVAPETAAAIGLTAAAPGDAETFYFAPAPLTADQRAAVSEAASNRSSTAFVLAGDRPAVAETDPNLSLKYTSPLASDAPGVTTAALIAASLVFTAFVVALGLALAARDTRDERDVLEAVGAPPRTIRRIAGARAGVLALLGAVLATPTGLLPVWVVTQASRPVLPFTVPWTSLAILVIALPAVIGLVAVAGGGLTSRFRPATASGFAAD